MLIIAHVSFHKPGLVRRMFSGNRIPSRQTRHHELRARAALDPAGAPAEPLLGPEVLWSHYFSVRCLCRCEPVCCLVHASVGVCDVGYDHVAMYALLMKRSS